MILTQKKVDEMHLKMAKMMRDEAAKEQGNPIANMSLDSIIELHKEALKRMGYKPKRLPS